MSDNYKEIYLEPHKCACLDAGPIWCEDPMSCDNCGKPWTKYVQASEIEHLQKQIKDLEVCQAMTEVNFENYVEDKQDEVLQLQKENEVLRHLCLEFSSISRVAMGNHHALVGLCDEWADFRLKERAKQN